MDEKEGAKRLTEKYNTKASSIRKRVA